MVWCKGRCHVVDGTFIKAADLTGEFRGIKKQKTKNMQPTIPDMETLHRFVYELNKVERKSQKPCRSLVHSENRGLGIWTSD